MGPVIELTHRTEGYLKYEAGTRLPTQCGRSHSSARRADQTLILKLGPVRVELGSRLSRGPQGAIHLTPLEYRVLECLAQQAGMVVRQQQLMREIWGPDRVDDTRSLRIIIKQLRQKLEPDARRPRYLLTETGLGYRLCTDEGEPLTQSPQVR